MIHRLREWAVHERERPEGVQLTHDIRVVTEPDGGGYMDAGEVRWSPKGAEFVATFLREIADAIDKNRKGT